MTEEASVAKQVLFKACKNIMPCKVPLSRVCITLNLAAIAADNADSLMFSGQVGREQLTPGVREASLVLLSCRNRANGLNFVSAV